MKLLLNICFMYLASLGVFAQVNNDDYLFETDSVELRAMHEFCSNLVDLTCLFNKSIYISKNDIQNMLKNEELKDYDIYDSIKINLFSDVVSAIETKNTKNGGVDIFIKDKLFVSVPKPFRCEQFVLSTNRYFMPQVNSQKDWLLGFDNSIEVRIDSTMYVGFINSLKDILNNKSESSLDCIWQKHNKFICRHLIQYDTINGLSLSCGCVIDLDKQFYDELSSLCRKMLHLIGCNRIVFDSPVVMENRRTCIETDFLYKYRKISLPIININGKLLSHSICAEYVSHLDSFEVYKYFKDVPDGTILFPFCYFLAGNFTCAITVCHSNNSFIISTYNCNGDIISQKAFNGDNLIVTEDYYLYTTIGCGEDVFYIITPNGIISETR